MFPDPEYSPAWQFEIHELEMRVRAEMARLKPEQWAVIVYRYYLGYCESEISNVIGSSL